MWVEIRQRISGWLGSDRSATRTDQDDFRISEPVLSHAPDMHMQDVGKGNVQIGQNNGQVRVVTLKQERNVTNIHYHKEAEPAPVEMMSAQQKEVFAMICRLPNSDSTYAFMERSFGTRMVMDLQPSQVLRVRRYVEAIKKTTQRGGKKRD